MRDYCQDYWMQLVDEMRKEVKQITEEMEHL